MRFNKSTVMVATLVMVSLFVAIPAFANSLHSVELEADCEGYSLFGQVNQDEVVVGAS